MSRAEMRSSMAWHAQGALVGYIAGIKNLIGRVAGFWCGQGSDQQGFTCHGENSGFSFVEFGFNGRRKNWYLLFTTL